MATPRHPRLARRLASGLLVAIALLILPASAHAGARCPTKTATVLAGAANVIDVDLTKPAPREQHEPSEDVLDDALEPPADTVEPSADAALAPAPDEEAAPRLKGKTLRFGHGYELRGAVRIRFGRTTYTATAGTRFQLNCYGQTKGGKLYPALALVTGKLTVKAVPGQPGGVITGEGLINPSGTGQRLTYSVKRSWKLGAPDGKTTVSAKRKGKVMSVTPYVGSKPGKCIYGHSYTLDGTAGGKGRVSYS